MRNKHLDASLSLVTTSVSLGFGSDVLLQHNLLDASEQFCDASGVIGVLDGMPFLLHKIMNAANMFVNMFVNILLNTCFLFEFQ